MTRETRIALLVGLAFIVLFGLVLGQRSLSLTVNSRGANPAATAPVGERSAPEAVVASLTERDERPVLSGPENPSGPASGGPPVRQEQALTAQHPPQAPPAQPAGHEGGAPPPPSQTGRSVTTRPAAGERTHTVAQGDTLIRIARRYYGRGHEGEYRRIYLANQDKLRSETALPLGTVLAIPSPPATPAGGGLAQAGGVRQVTLDELATQVARGSYVVQKGDTLTEIARKTLGGDRAGLRKILDANRDRIEDPNRLRVGMTLRIPS